MAVAAHRRDGGLRGRLARSRVRARLRRIAVILGSIALLGVLAARADLRPDLAHVHVRMLSGPEQGNYHAIVDAVARAAAKKRGVIENVPSAGSRETLDRLVAAEKTCDVRAGLVQAGLPVPSGSHLDLLARLAKSESLMLLGKRADAIADFASLAHLRIGIGPEGGGTATLVRQIFESRDFKSLGAVLSYHSVDEQLALAAKGDLDLAAFVIDEDAELVQRAVRDLGLALAGFPHADVVARQFGFLRKGRIGAGEYDAVRMLPPVDKEVLRVDTLVVGNGCAKRSEVMGIESSLLEVFPELARHNKETPNTSGLDLAPAAKAYWDTGTELLDVYLPRVSDVMPPSNWLHLVMAVSILFNVMGLANRFVLWRIDASRVRSEQDIASCFGPAVTLGDIARIAPQGELLGDEIDAHLQRVIHDLEALAASSRKLSLSVLVPMGGEMVYRYQESLVHQTLAVLRAFHERWEAARKASDPPA